MDMRDLTFQLLFGIIAVNLTTQSVKDVGFFRMRILWLFSLRQIYVPLSLVTAQPAPRPRGHTPISQDGSILPLYILLRLIDN